MKTLTTKVWEVQAAAAEAMARQAIDYFERGYLHEAARCLSDAAYYAHKAVGELYGAP